MRIGIDLGGTNTAAALVDERGGIIKRVSIKTDSSGGAQTVIDGLITVCENLLSGAGGEPTSIGIGVPGTVDAKKGEVIFTPNLPLSGVSITSDLHKKYACPICIGNDANCAALGEYIAGGAKGARDAVLITLGTGVGGGIIIDGKLHNGVSGAAGELGHMVIVAGGRACGCGRHGCLESYGSSTAIKRTAKEFMGLHKDSAMWGLCGGKTDELSGRSVFEAYRAGDHAAILTVEHFLEHLAAGIVNIINILEPEMICIGGGVSNEWDDIAIPLQKKVDAERYPHTLSDKNRTKIVRAVLGNDADIIGAAML